LAVAAVFIIARTQAADSYTILSLAADWPLCRLIYSVLPISTQNLLQNASELKEEL
jgi:hypothetical protein